VELTGKMRQAVKIRGEKYPAFWAREKLMDTFEKAQKCAQFADEKKGRDIVILELIGAY